MTNNTTLCIDANIWIKLLTEEPDTPLAEQFLTACFKQRRTIVAPSIMKLEVGSIFRKKLSRKLLNADAADELWHRFLALPVHYIDTEALLEDAWRIAKANRLTNLYDAVYISAAQEGELWTADERLVNSASETRASIRLLRRDYPGLF